MLVSDSCQCVSAPLDYWGSDVLNLRWEVVPVFLQSDAVEKCFVLSFIFYSQVFSHRSCWHVFCQHLVFRTSAGWKYKLIIIYRGKRLFIATLLTGLSWEKIVLRSLALNISVSLWFLCKLQKCLQFKRSELKKPNGFWLNLMYLFIFCQNWLRRRCCCRAETLRSTTEPGGGWGRGGWRDTSAVWGWYLPVLSRPGRCSSTCTTDTEYQNISHVEREQPICILYVASFFIVVGVRVEY